MISIPLIGITEYTTPKGILSAGESCPKTNVIYTKRDPPTNLPKMAKVRMITWINTLTFL